MKKGIGHVFASSAAMKQSFTSVLVFAMAFALAFLAACGDDDSSFAPRDDEPTSSSWSSEGTIGSSSSVRSSSSSVTPKSSSSETSVSSSSAKSSSSVASSSSAKSSSSESSSSIENPWGTDEEWWPFSCNAHGGCLEFTDTRNNRTYKY
ncbi:MAG: hypothetical protein IJ177_05225, partial [Fibrobacter sp.]|nr:hypothetical protein [Fibrobacter sp.]